MSTHGDGGKGSGRRNEDTQKVHDNWDAVFGKGKNMNEEEDNIEEEEEFDDTCTWCGGCGEGDYDGAACRHCHGTGIDPVDKDFDDSFID